MSPKLKLVKINIPYKVLPELPKLTFSSQIENNIYLLEKFLVASMVVNIAPLSLRRALNFLRQSTVS